MRAGREMLVRARSGWAWLRRKFRGKGRPLEGSYWLTRILTLRALGFIYCVAFYSLARQLRALIGEHGILPAGLFLDRVKQAYGEGFAAYWKVPTIFVWGHSDAVLLGCCYLGVALSALALLGYANGILMAVLWILYMSFVHAGQLFYGYGWEMMLLEAGFFAIFLCHPWRGGLFPKNDPAPVAVMWLYRWFLFRLMFGAGMIKIRGDESWRNLTALYYHFETQPIPNPVSWYFHHLPDILLKGGVVFNHFVELIVPFFLFGPRLHRQIAGLLTIVFQGLLILGGNLSFLNWLTIAIAIPCFDDRALRWLVPGRWRERAAGMAVKVEAAATIPTSRDCPPCWGRWVRQGVIGALVCLVLVLSWRPFRNLFFPAGGQVMNASYNRWNLVNTYGMFGSVGKRRFEIVLEGTRAEELRENTVWEEYDFKAKPTDVFELPPAIAPYHLRLDWQIWFAAMSDYRRDPWVARFVWLLLEADADALGLLERDPFGGERPRFIRATYYEYRFTTPEERRATGAWWHRERMGLWLPPVSLEDESLRRFLGQFGWAAG